MDKWKTVSIILLISVILLGYIFYNNQFYNFGDGFKVKKSIVDKMIEEMGSPIEICDIDNNRCVKLGKIES